MTKIIKYLKPFTLMLLLAIVLLYAQAQTDLALPDYMSDIVNVGIQQSGISHTSIDVITQTDFDHMLLFLSEQEANMVKKHYVLKTPEASNYVNLTKKYTALSGVNVYALIEISSEEQAVLDVVMAKGLLALQGVETMILDAGDGPIQFGPQQLPAGTDVFQVLSNLPGEVRQEMLSANQQGFSTMDDKLIVQAGTRAVKTRLEAYGLDVEKKQRGYILTMGGIMLLVTALGAACAISVGFLAARVAAGLGRNLRTAIFTKIESFSNHEFDQFSTASLITRSTNDVMQIQNLMVMMVRMLFYAPIMGVGGVIRALDKSTSMSWIIAIAVIVLLGLIMIIFSIALPKFKLVQKMIDKINLVTRESLSGMMVIRAFNTQKFEENRFDDANKDLTAVNLFVNRVMVFMFPMMMFIMNGVTLLIVWVGAQQIEASAMQVGDMMAFMQYALQIIFAFLMMSMMFIMLPRAAVSAQRIAEVLETAPTVVDPIKPMSWPVNPKGLVAFDQVSFRYPGAEEDMLKNISFTAHPGQTTAIIGSTGSGKSTLINMIPRFYDVTKGSVTIDGIDVREMKQSDVRQVIGYVPQKVNLFSGTIKSNLIYGDKKASDQTLKHAIEVAQASEFIDAKEEGIEASISQGGGNVSGGQKQRLSIARAIVKKPRIYIFDDSFSALDFKTDRQLRQALNEATGDSTIIIVAQRISTIKHADQILVLEDGELVGLGTHEALMKTCQTYQEIAYSQLSKEELA